MNAYHSNVFCKFVYVVKKLWIEMCNLLVGHKFSIKIVIFKWFGLGSKIFHSKKKITSDFLPAQHQAKKQQFINLHLMSSLNGLERIFTLQL